MTYLISGSSGIYFISLLFLFLSSVGDSIAQVQFNRKIFTAEISSAQLKNQTPEELKILGVMVEFLPDNNRFTSGNGTFNPGSIPYLENPGTSIDALPHNKQYFEAHLEFSKNYFERVSGGNITLEFEVLPDVYQLENTMDEYSPIGEDPDFSVMGKLIRDVWTSVSKSGELSMEYQESDNIAFVVFHAGVGRDIELTGTNLDKTPQDLPSLYLNRDTLSDFFNDPSFSGFPIDNGNLLVDNTLIIPRTLSRAGTDAAGNRFLLPLSINGLLTAQIGSHLGLPDLFNTATGRSGIGQFGLMDGASIFAFNGLFPPEPSAWEKIQLGWIKPEIIASDSEVSVSLPAVSLQREGNIAKIPLSNDEFFLVENRHRDPNNEGITLTIKKENGTYIEQTFTNKDTDFVNREPGFDTLLEPGVVVNVSNYDFSLPGGVSGNDNSGNNEILNGGILIWHIDKNIIENKISTGGINDDPGRRGVDLEEADGAQDIGRPVSIGLFQNEMNGSAFDFWWSQNSSSVIIQSDTLQLYENRFGPDTTPNNESNSGAPSYFELFDFSDIQPVADFKFRPIQPYADLFELWDTKSELNLLTFSESGDEYWNRYPLAIQPVSIDDNTWIMLPGYDGIHLYNPDSKKILEHQVDINTLQQPFINKNFFTVADNPLEANRDFSVRIYEFDGQNLFKLNEYNVQPNGSFISSLGGNILYVDGTNNQIDLDKNQIQQSGNPIQISETVNGYQSRVESGSLILQFAEGTESFGLNRKNRLDRIYTGIFQDNENRIFFYLLEDGELSIYDPGNNYQTRRRIHKSKFIDWPAFTDLDRDGSTDFLFVDYSTNQVIAKNIHGAFVSSFPISAPKNIMFIGRVWPIVGFFLI